MGTDDTRALATRYMALLDQQDLDGAADLCAPDCVWHGFGPESVDRHGFVQWMRALFEGFPDARFPVDDLLVEGSKAANRHRMLGTHSALFQGIPATGRQVTVRGMDIVHCANGQIQEFWLTADILGLLQQLGVIPQPEAATA
jgi:steroid delta-isomerase-like uncharacterized protein